MKEKMFSLAKFPIEHKRVLLRVDWNVPLKDNKITDNRKIRASLATINYLREKNCDVIIITHLGRPKGELVKKLRLKPLIKQLRDLLPNEKIHYITSSIGINKRVKNKKGIIVLENLRFYAQETKNDIEFARNLAKLADVYVNDAFAVSHRAHASVTGIPTFLPSIPGFLIEHELYHLSKAITGDRPITWIMGGGKIGKMQIFMHALKHADRILVGGALPFPFMRAQGIPIGMSKIDVKSVEMAKKVLAKKNKKKLVFPVDYITATKSSRTAKAQVSTLIPSNHIALDIGPKTIKLFTRHCRGARTIIWNGPMGVFEYAQFAKGTKSVGRVLAKLTATTICGGGETAQALRLSKVDDLIDHISTGGGAALAFMSQDKMPGLDALRTSYKKYTKNHNIDIKN